MEKWRSRVEAVRGSDGANGEWRSKWALAEGGEAMGDASGEWVVSCCGSALRMGVLIDRMGEGMSSRWKEREPVDEAGLASAC